MAGNTTENELEERAKQIDVALKKALQGASSRSAG